MVICEMINCQRQATYAACVKEDSADRMEIAILRKLCDKHILYSPAWHQVQAIYAEQMQLLSDIRKEQEP